MTAKPAPFSKAVRAAALDCLDGGEHRLLIFAGPAAWRVAKDYVLGGKPTDVCASRRDGHVLVLPPDETMAAAQYRWPVERRAVVVIDTGVGLRQLEPLVDALVRDRACSCWHYRVTPDCDATDVGCALQGLHNGYPLIPIAHWHDVWAYHDTAAIAAAG